MGNFLCYNLLFGVISSGIEKWVIEIEGCSVFSSWGLKHISLIVVVWMYIFENSIFNSAILRVRLFSTSYLVSKLWHSSKSDAQGQIGSTYTDYNYLFFFLTFSFHLTTSIGFVITSNKLQSLMLMRYHIKHLWVIFVLIEGLSHGLSGENNSDC